MDRKINLFSSESRDRLITELSSNHFDLIVIGGGITGAGVCLDAVSQGLKVCLIEMNDFASGTSSKSTKLIHGGLRYLEQLKFKLVHETGNERGVLHRIAPHLVKSEKMLLPIKKDGKLGIISTTLALSVYDYLANVKKNDRKEILKKHTVQNKEPLLKRDGLIGGAIYSEYRTDDSRLTIELLKKASTMGAYPINYVKFLNFILKDKKIIGLECKDVLKKKKLSISGSVVVNASGPWVDEILNKKKNKLCLSKGIHIVVPYDKFPLKQSIYFDAIDERMIFAIPRDKSIYIGTTDTEYKKNKNDINILKSEVMYLINSVNNMFSVELKIDDVFSSWAGIRPLIKETGKKVTEISRKDEIYISDNGLITIAGGKLTGYRKMASRVINEVIKKINFMNSKRIDTKNLFLYESNDLKKTKQELIIYFLENNIFSKNEVLLLYDMYGENTYEIIKISKSIKSKNIKYSILIAELEYCYKNEMCHNLIDFFTQRTSRVYFDTKRIPKLIPVIKEPYKKLKNISEKEFNSEKAELNKYLKKITNFI